MRQLTKMSLLQLHYTYLSTRSTPHWVAQIMVLRLLGPMLILLHIIYIYNAAQQTSLAGAHTHK